MKRVSGIGFLCAAVLWTLPALADTTPPRLDSAFPNYQPPFPDAAQVNGEQGNVMLDIHVAANGKVIGVRIHTSSGFADLDNAAIEGALGWHFVPATENGDTTAAWTTLSVQFQLPKAAGP